MNHLYTLSKTGPKGWKVEISPSTSYGYFEKPDGSEGGGLWFDGKNLSDYDGSYILSRECCDLITALGYGVGADFYPDGYVSGFVVQILLVGAPVPEWVLFKVQDTLLEAEQSIDQLLTKLPASRLRILSRSTAPQGGV